LSRIFSHFKSNFEPYLIIYGSRPLAAAYKFAELLIEDSASSAAEPSREQSRTQQFCDNPKAKPVDASLTLTKQAEPHFLQGELDENPG
jgi:hypothetical protein